MRIQFQIMNQPTSKGFILGSAISLSLILTAFAQSTPRQASRDTPSPQGSARQARRDKPSPSPAAKQGDALLDRKMDQVLKDIDFAIACEHGETAKVKEFLAKGTDPNTRDVHKNPVLINAVIKDKPEVVRVLLEAKADPNLLSFTSAPPLVFAAEKGNVEIISLLLKAGANVNHRQKSDDPKFAANNGTTPLISAIMPNASAEVVHTLVRAGADVNAKADNGLSAILKAAMQGNVDAVKALIEHKADVNVKSNPPKDITPVMGAVLASKKVSNRGEVIKLLAAAGADVNAKTSEGFTAPKIATSQGDVVIQKALLDAGATDF